jgi:hypothetical protein
MKDKTESCEQTYVPIGNPRFIIGGFRSRDPSDKFSLFSLNDSGILLCCLLLFFLYDFFKKNFSW